MKPLYDVIEGLLDADFDITDDDILSSRLCDWIQTANKKPFNEASSTLMDILSDASEISPMRRSNLAETNTIISIVPDPASKGGKISIVYRGKKSCYSHITFTWYNGQQYRNGRFVSAAYIQKGINNMVEFKNKRKSSMCGCWAIRPEIFDDMYKHVPRI